MKEETNETKLIETKNIGGTNLDSFMLTGLKNKYTKEEEIHFGELVQAGIKAKHELEESDELTNARIKELKRIVEDGDEAYENLFVTHIGLANYLAKLTHRTTKTNYPLSDLAQDAYFALSEATKTYDPSRKCVLSTHAYYKITKALSVQVNKMRPIRLPENKMGDYLHITKAEAEYTKLNNGVVDQSKMLDYVVDKTGLSRDTIALIKNAIKGSVSLNKEIGEGSGQLGDLVEDPNSVRPNEIENTLLADIIFDLPQFERDVLAFESQVGTPSMSLNDFLLKHDMTSKDLEKKGKQIIRALRKKMSARKKG